MTELGPPAKHHVAAAVGWLELGCPAEAAAELAKLEPELRDHPEALEARWQVCAVESNWDAALSVAEVLVQKDPKHVSGWLHRAYALRRATRGGLKPASEVLKPAYERFPQVSLVSYNLACYAAQLGDLIEAWDWLQKSLRVAESRQGLITMALADPDLQPLWDRIRQL